MPTARSKFPPPQSSSALLLNTVAVGKREVDERPVPHRQPTLSSRRLQALPVAELFEAIQSNDRDFVQQLLAITGKASHLGQLLEHADPKTGRTPLTAALVRGHLDLAVDLMLLGASPSADDLHLTSPLEIAGDDGIPAMLVQFMLWRETQAPSSVKTMDRHLQQRLDTVDRQTGHTLLTWAISQGHDALVELLVDAGANARIVNRFGRNALNEACSTGNIPSVCHLLQRWIGPDTRLWVQELVAAIGSAVKADRPMVVAQLLSFFRDKYRLRQQDIPENEDEHLIHPVTPNLMTQRDAYGFFRGSQPASSATMDVLMDRTSDIFLLRANESLLLQLDKIVVWAGRENKTQIVEIIHAHATLPQGL